MRARRDRFVNRVPVRRWRRLQRSEAVPPLVERDPVAVGVVLAWGSRTTHLDRVDGMNLPEGSAHRRAAGPARARRVRRIKEQLPRDAIRMGLQSSADLWIHYV